MEHNFNKELLQLYLYNELSDSERVQVEKHLTVCDDCSREFEELKQMLSTLKNEMPEKINASILYQARQELREKLRQQRVGESENSFGKFFSFISTPLKFAFASIIFLVIGVGLGYLFFGNPVALSENIRETDLEQSIDTKQYYNLRFIDSDASDGEIEFTFDSVTPERIKGKITDPKIQTLLSYAILNDKNPGSRLNSIYALNSSAATKIDNEVKDALITSMLTDENPGVRLEALKVIKNLPYDNQIKQALLYVLTKDSSSALRIEAINSLNKVSESGITFDQKEVSLFKQALQNEDNSYIKLQTKKILKEYN